MSWDRRRRVGLKVIVSRIGRPGNVDDVGAFRGIIGVQKGLRGGGKRATPHSRWDKIDFALYLVYELNRAKTRLIIVGH